MRTKRTAPLYPFAVRNLFGMNPFRASLAALHTLSQLALALS